MGQRRLGRRSYDAFARQRVVDKLDHIQSLYPGLSLEEIAAQIAEARGATFDRRYFSRLKDGSLSDALTRRIVEWITWNHDPNFEETLSDEGERFTQATVSKHAVISKREWLPMAATDAKALGDIAAPFGLPSEFSKEASVEFRALSFLRAARVLKFHPHRRASFFTHPLYLLEGQGRLEALSGTQMLLEFHPLVDGSNLLDFVAFYFECIDASDGYSLCASPVDVLYLLLERKLPYAQAAALVSNDIAPLFEAPLIQESLEPKGYVIRADAVSGDFLRRLFIHVSDALEVTVTSDRMIAGLPKSSPGEIQQSSIAQGEAIERDVEHLLEVMRLSPTGDMLTKTYALHKIPVLQVAGANGAFFYDEAIDRIINIRPPSPLEAGEEAVALAYAIRLLDQTLLGLRLPEPLEDMKEYSTVAHGKNMDAVVYTSRVAIELQQTPHGAAALRQIRRAGLIKVFEVVRRGGSKEEVFRAYASS